MRVLVVVVVHSGGLAVGRGAEYIGPEFVTADARQAFDSQGQPRRDRARALDPLIDGLRADVELLGQGLLASGDS